jgi:hypothetical protein
MSRQRVLSPLGYPPKVVGKGLAPSLDTLEGKTVFLVDVGFENSDNFMHELQAWMAEHQPAVRTEVIRWRNQHEPDPEVAARVKAEGHAAILGVGL